MKKLKKLSLKKETVANLSDHEMNAIQGGVAYTTISSKPCAYAINAAVTYTIGKTLDIAGSYFNGCSYEPEPEPELSDAPAHGLFTCDILPPVVVRPK